MLACPVYAHAAEAEDQWWTEEEAELLARMIHAEARGESEKGQLAVAQCAIDRHANGGFGITLKDVITKPHQFAVSKTFEDNHMEIALEALNGAKVYDDYEVLYFRRTSSKNNWYAPRIGKIGGHSFYGNYIL